MKLFKLLVFSFLLVSQAKAVNLGVTIDSGSRILSPTNITINGVKLSNVAVSRALVTDSIGNVTNSVVTASEIGTLSGVSGNIQAQIDSISGGGGGGSTNDFSTLSNYVNMPAFLSSNTNIVNVYPYDTSSTVSANFGGSGTQTEQSFLQYGNTYRVRQNGIITQVYFYMPSVTGISGLYINIWRQIPDGTFDLISTSANLTSSIANGFNTLTVSLAARQGDYLGIRTVWSSSGVSTKNFGTVARATTTSVESLPTAQIYSIFNINPGSTNYAWLSQTVSNNVAIPIEARMVAPVGVAFGDSIISGTYANNSFVDRYSTNSAPTTTIPWKLQEMLGVEVQNMGIGAQTTTALLARFTNDVINLHPKFVILEGGLNDIFQGVALATSTNNIGTMVKAAYDNGIWPIILQTGPWNLASGDAGFHAANQVIQDYWAIVGAVYGTNIVSSYDIIGKFRVGGTTGNNWDLKSELADPALDGHYNEKGNTLIAAAIVESMTGIRGFNFASLGVGNLNITGNLTLRGTGNKIIQQTRPLAPKLKGGNLELRAQGASVNAMNTEGGTNILSGGISTGNKGSAVSFYAASPGSSGVGENIPVWVGEARYPGITANKFFGPSDSTTYIGFPAATQMGFYSGGSLKAALNGDTLAIGSDMQLGLISGVIGVDSYTGGIKYRVGGGAAITTGSGVAAPISASRYYGSADTNTYIGFPAANQFGFFPNGSLTVGINATSWAFKSDQTLGFVNSTLGVDPITGGIQTRVGGGIKIVSDTSGTLGIVDILGRAYNAGTWDSSTRAVTEDSARDEFENRAPKADPIFTSSLQIPNGAAPTTDAFGEIAGDNNAWGVNRGAVQFFDGTANTWLVGVLTSDTPSNGQVPTWNTGGTITWETPSGGGGGSAPVGTMVSNGSTYSVGSVPISTDTTGTNFTGTATLIITGTNASFKGTIFADNIVSTNGLTMSGTNAAVTGNLSANGGIFTNLLTLNGVGALTNGQVYVNGTLIPQVTPPNFSGNQFAASTVTNVVIKDGALITNVVLTTPNIGTPSAGTIDFTGAITGSFLDYIPFIYPHKIDGVGTTIVTNDYTSGFSGLVKYAGTGGTNANFAIYRVGIVPLDLDTGTPLVLKNLGFVVSGTDTGSASFSIALYSPASSSAFSPTDFTALSTYINFTTGTLTSPVANDQFYFADVTLTGWAAALTPGRPFIIGIARDGGDSNNDTLTLTGGAISYKKTQ